MRVLVLGMPGSGTSYFAGILDAGGIVSAGMSYSGMPWKGCGESCALREFNRRALDGWRPSRFGPAPRVRVDEHDIRAMRAVVELADAAHDRWHFKNPESVLLWDSIWSRVEWDAVLGIYRHPLGTIASVARDHLPPSACARYDLEQTWCRWNEIVLRASSRVFRFPYDGQALARMFDLGDPEEPTQKYVTNPVDGPVPEACEDVWNRLEEARCASTTAAAM